MKINNKRIIFPINLVHFILILGLAFCLVAMYFKMNFPIPKLEYWMVLILILLVFYFLKNLGHQHFEYDSDGEVLNFTTKNVAYDKRIGDYKINVELPKGKLISYKIKKGFLTETLYINVTSKTKGVKTLKFNLTYLNKTEKNSLKKSLKKVVEENKLKLNG